MIFCGNTAECGGIGVLWTHLVYICLSFTFHFFFFYLWYIYFNNVTFILLQKCLSTDAPDFLKKVIFVTLRKHFIEGFYLLVYETMGEFIWGPKQYIFALYMCHFIYFYLYVDISVRGFITLKICYIMCFVFSM